MIADAPYGRAVAMTNWSKVTRSSFWRRTRRVAAAEEGAEGEDVDREGVNVTADIAAVRSQRAVEPALDDPVALSWRIDHDAVFDTVPDARAEESLAAVVPVEILAVVGGLIHVVDMRRRQARVRARSARRSSVTAAETSSNGRCPVVRDACRSSACCTSRKLQSIKRCRPALEAGLGQRQLQPAIRRCADPPIRLVALASLPTTFDIGEHPSSTSPLVHGSATQGDCGSINPIRSLNSPTGQWMVWRHPAAVDTYQVDPG